MEASLPPSPRESGAGAGVLPQPAIIHSAPSSPSSAEGRHPRLTRGLALAIWSLVTARLDALTWTLLAAPNRWPLSRSHPRRLSPTRPSSDPAGSSAGSGARPRNATEPRHSLQRRIPTPFSFCRWRRAGLRPHTRTTSSAVSPTLQRRNTTVLQQGRLHTSIGWKVGSGLRRSSFRDI